MKRHLRDYLMGSGWAVVGCGIVAAAWNHFPTASAFIAIPAALLVAAEIGVFEAQKEPTDAE